MKRIIFIFYLTVLFVTSLSAQDTKNNIKVFPNPATNVINVLGLENDNNAEIFIIDSYGNTIVTHQWDIKNNSLNIPVFHLDQGVYVLTIKTNHQQIQQKFLKQ